MSGIDTVNKFQKPMLESLGCSFDETQQIFYKAPYAKKPEAVNISVSLKGKTRQLPVYLPLDDYLKNMDPKRILFFPFCESIWKGNSPVLNALLRLMNVRIHSATVDLLIGLAGTYFEKDSENVGNEVIEVIKGFDWKSSQKAEVTRFLKTARKAKGFGLDAVAGIKLVTKPSPEMKTTRCAHLRVLNTERDKMFGQDPTQQTRDIVQQLLDSIFVDKNDYVATSNYKSSPSLYSILAVFATIADRLNELQRALGKYHSPASLIPDDWFDALTDFEELDKFHRNHIPAKLPHNVGSEKDNGPQAVETNTNKETPVARRYSADKPTAQHNEPQHGAVSREDIRQEPVQEERAPAARGPLTGMTLGGSKGAVHNARPLNPGQDDIQPHAYDMHGNRVGAQREVYRDNEGYLVSRSGPQTRVVPRQQPIEEQKVHACTKDGIPLYYQDNVPFMIYANDPYLNAYWAADQYGRGAYSRNGEPILVDEYDREISLEQAMGHMGHGHMHSGHSGHLHGGHGGYPQRRSLHGGTESPMMPSAQMYSPQELARMSFAERSAAMREMKEMDELQQRYMGGGRQPSYNQQPNQFHVNINDHSRPIHGGNNDFGGGVLSFNTVAPSAGGGNNSPIMG